MIFRLPPRARGALATIASRVTAMEGEPVIVRFRDDMGPVHAGSDLRRRTMWLEDDLLRYPDELRRIFIHEAYHFVWARLGNQRRWAYEALLKRELDAHARGELGWSAEGLKLRLTKTDRQRRTRKWREYVCESFCDTAAWKYAGLSRHDEWTLAARFRRKRAECLAALLNGRKLPA